MLICVLTGADQRSCHQMSLSDVKEPVFKSETSWHKTSRGLCPQTGEKKKHHPMEKKNQVAEMTSPREVLQGLGTHGFLPG